MLEIEVKSPCSDLKPVEQRLKEMGATFIEERMEEDTYFDHPCRDFGETDEALRLRRVDGELTLTYKGERIGEETKIREELSTGVGTGACGQILKSLGFSEVGTVIKNRKIYLVDDIEVCLDTVQNLGTFVELEISGEDPGKERKRLFQMMELLGLEENVRLSYLELLMRTE